jgi:hypothetical protein
LHEQFDSCSKAPDLLVQRLQRRVHAGECQVLPHHVEHGKRRQMNAAHCSLEFSENVILVRLDVKGERGGAEVDGYFLVLGVQADGREERSSPAVSGGGGGGGARGRAAADECSRGRVGSCSGCCRADFKSCAQVSTVAGEENFAGSAKRRTCDERRRGRGGRGGGGGCT